MIVITCWRELEPFGIDLLTGESLWTVLSLPLRCDVPRSTHRREVPGLSAHAGGELESRHDGSPHVGSLMLAPELFNMLCIFALLESGMHRSLRRHRARRSRLRAERTTRRPSPGANATTAPASADASITAARRGTATSTPCPAVSSERTTNVLRHVTPCARAYGVVDVGVEKRAFGTGIGL